MFPDSGPRGCLERTVVLVFGFELQETGDLTTCLAVLLPIDQHSAVVGSCGPVGRRESEYFFQKALRVVKCVTSMRNSPEQAQCLDVPARASQECAQNTFCEIQIAVAEQTSGLNNLCRQALEHRDVFGRAAGLLQIADDAIQALEHAPTRGQRRVDVDGLLECIDRALHIVHRREAVSSFLMETTEARGPLLKTIQRSQSRCVSVQGTLIDCGEIKNVATFGCVCLECRDRDQRLIVRLSFSQGTDARDLHRIVMGLQQRLPSFLSRQLASCQSNYLSLKPGREGKYHREEYRSS